MTQGVQQHTQKTSWREKADVWPKKFGDTKPTMTPSLKPLWIDIDNHTFDLTGQKTGDIASDHEISMQMWEKEWNSYDTITYTDSAVTHECKR